MGDHSAIEWTDATWNPDKQWGGRTPKAGGRLLDGRIYEQFPSFRSARDGGASARALTGQVASIAQ
jgi:protein gp37